jgi:hypothetical protein
MTDLCGSSENLISIVKYTLRKGLNDDDATDVSSRQTPTNTNQILSKESSSSPTNELLKNNDDSDVGENDNTNNNIGENSNNGGNDNQADDKNCKSKNVEDDDNDNEHEVVDRENNEDDIVAPVSDLSDPNRRICVVTTAGLPWRYVNLLLSFCTPFLFLLFFSLTNCSFVLISCVCRLDFYTERGLRSIPWLEHCI